MIDAALPVEAAAGPPVADNPAGKRGIEGFCQKIIRSLTRQLDRIPN
jgi:hypothetical protein